MGLGLGLCSRFGAGDSPLTNGGVTFVLNLFVQKWFHNRGKDANMAAMGVLVCR